MDNDITFDVDTRRVLQILTKEIYDSPYAMLRENTQNAYDAIRERFSENSKLKEGGRIDITITDSSISIKDNGIGMSDDVLRNHFWKTGSSGKHSVRARDAGVVGTFGIGAMANFGVCSHISIKTKSIDTEEAFRTSASLDSLDIGKKCIKLENIDCGIDFGTTIDVELQPSHLISEEKAIQYLLPYIEYLPVPVFINGKLINKKEIRTLYDERAGYETNLGIISKVNAQYSGIFDVKVARNASVSVICSELKVSGQAILGEIYLRQNGGQLMGLRSYFGLAPSPAIGAYRFGGIANLTTLHPTAGREALSRESIAEINAFIQLAESAASESIAAHRLADENTSFIQWVAENKRFDLSDNVTIKMFPDNKDMKLINVKNDTKHNIKHYYVGSDKDIIETFSNEESMLLIPSSSHYKKIIQTSYLAAIGIKSVPDEPRIIKIYRSTEINISEIKILYRILSILRDDYLIADCEIQLAEISHGVAVLPRQEGNTLNIFINKKSSFLTPAQQFSEKAPELWGDYMIDFVRTYLYSKIQQFVPSATKMGVEALKRQLEKSRELYAYKQSESGFIDDLFGGELEESLKGFFDGTLSLSQVISTSKQNATPQAQRVSHVNVGEIESVMYGIENITSGLNVEGQEEEGGQDQDQSDELMALPPIDRRTVETDKKILTAKTGYQVLNKFTLFIGVSDKLMKTEADFFYSPHTTRVIWSGHRVVYIFTEQTGNINLYYDIELKNPISPMNGYGGSFRTTTLITKNRIFIPVPDQLIDEFKVESETKEFFVRHDILYSHHINDAKE